MNLLHDPPVKGRRHPAGARPSLPVGIGRRSDTRRRVAARFVGNVVVGAHQATPGNFSAGPRCSAKLRGTMQENSHGIGVASQHLANLAGRHRLHVIQPHRGQRIRLQNSASRRPVICFDRLAWALANGSLSETFSTSRPCAKHRPALPTTAGNGQPVGDGEYPRAESPGRAIAPKIAKREQKSLLQ